MTAAQTFEEVTPDHAVKMQGRGAVLLDVREDDEWAAGHAPRAEHVPLARLGAVVARFGGRPVLTVCRSGRRSALAAQALAEAGVDAHNVSGGMSAWQRAGLPVIREDGTPGAVA